MVRDHYLASQKKRGNNRTASPTGERASQSNRIEIPEISLPKGGGALKGIDEKFSVNPANGTSSVGVALPVASARNGFSPSLGLAYNSGFGNSPFGLGWNIDVPSIRRKTEKELPQYRDDLDSDTFVLSGSEDLVPLLKENGTTGEWEPQTRETSQYRIKQYRPRIEGLWSRIEQWRQKSSGVIHWRTISPNNVTSFFGIESDSRIADPADEDLKIFEWRLSHAFDDRGNLIMYRYKREDFAGVPQTVFEKNIHAGNCTDLYLKKVLYGNQTPYKRGDALPSENDFLFETVFDYGEHETEVPQPDGSDNWDMRPDPFSSYRSGFNIRTYRSCRRILLFHKFEELPVNPYLVSATELVHEDFPGPEPTEKNLEGFTYLKKIIQRGYKYNPVTDSYDSKMLPPLSYQYQPHEWETEITKIEAGDAYNAPMGIDFQQYRWVDLYSEGLSGILAEKSDGWFYKRNLGNGHFTPAEVINPKPSFSGLQSGSLQLQDLEGAGTPYLVNWAEEPKGFFRFNDDQSWSPFQPFEKMPARDMLEDANARFIDVTGDGLPDVLLSEDEFFQWHESKGEQGFGEPNFIRKAPDEEKGPRVVFADIEQSVFLADMSGDGLTDLVRIRNGEICYWPNLGYGQFGSKVTMGDAPRFDSDEEFNSRYFNLADIDGSGTTDIIYTGNETIRVWLNLSGNSWTKEPIRIHSFPAVDNLTDVAVLDLLGTGTSCMVWSSPLPAESGAPLRYIDLMNSKKPHLLNFYENNMGKEVSTTFKPSTHYYLEDRRRGEPWATKLPFPVHVVSNVKVEDKVRETLYASSYSYHHGYYDGKEREFRGFGRVEQRDSEEFSTFAVNETQNVVEKEHHQPPMRSVQWFHTGAPQSRLTEIYQDEFYHNKEREEYTLPASDIPDDLTTQEWYEAIRACKGLPLRQEMYADDGTDKESHPYSTAQSSYQVKCIQPSGKNKHATFQVIPSQSLYYTYERNPADPRITHSLALETDDKGIITKSAALVYPRLDRPDNIPDEVWAEQNQHHIIYAESDFTEDIDTDDEYRIRTVYESRGYELLGFTLPDTTLLSLQDLLDATEGAAEIPFEEEGDGSLQRRLSSQSRIYFKKNDLSGELPLARRESLGLVHRSMSLAFTEGLITQRYADKVDSAMLNEAGYVHSEGDNRWWAPTGTTLYPADAADRFYRPTGYRNALGPESHISWDPYLLLPESTTDALGNTMTVENDYRTLSPRKVTNANLNRRSVETDALGMVTKVALMGKAGEAEGDTLDDPTSRMEYDLLHWMNHSRPNFSHSWNREAHGVDNPRWQENYAYFDGSGGTIMSKTQAEPGKAKRWNSDTQSTEEVETDDRWVGNGRAILNNKGNPIKQYEPYFSTTFDYETESELVETGESAISFYDPPGRSIRTEFPNGTFAKVEFDPWHSKMYDANDTVKESSWYDDLGRPDPDADPKPSDPQQRAAWLAAKHADTPVTNHSDSLGRAIYSVADYGNNKTTAIRANSDLTGRHSTIIDQLQREIATGYSNMLGSSIYGESSEKGKQWVFQDVLGRIVKVWDNDSRELRSTYDVLNRPVSSFVREGDEELCFNHIVYGDLHPDAHNLNLTGKPYQVYDQAGVMTIKRADFKGNVLEVERRLCREYKDAINWQSLEGLAGITAIADAAEPQLEGETFSGSSNYDALDRPTEVALPDDTLIRPGYNEANYLDSLKAQILGEGPFVSFLENQDYDAKGQLQSTEYGNGTLTRYFYDPKTFRLTDTLTTKREDDGASQSLQNLKYTYDPVGNITQVRDEAQQTHYFQNAVVSPDRTFEYNAVYQLTRATGREHAGLGGNIQRIHQDIPAMSPLPHANDSTAVRTYREEYEYDDAGNITELRHRTSDGNGDWTRRHRYAYQDDPADRTNRLISNSLPGDDPSGPYSARYSYDRHGNMIGMPHLESLDWNFQDQLRHVDLGGGGDAWYIYSGSGTRRRKVIERPGGQQIEHIYLGAVEIYREWQGGTGDPRLERWTVHIGGSHGRIAQVDTKTIDLDNSDPSNPLNTPLIRYQYTDHLGSAVLETNEEGAVISYEEYHPFGTTAYRSTDSAADVSLKRYRFSGKERDNETGLYYYGARYYANWLGRWTSSDPAGFVDGMNLYVFSQNNPVRFIDSFGMQSEDWDGVQVVEQRQFTGEETLSELKSLPIPAGYKFDPTITSENFSRENYYVEGSEAGGAGGTWVVIVPDEQASGENDSKKKDSNSEKAATTTATGSQQIRNNPKGETIEVLDETERSKVRRLKEGIRRREIGRNTGPENPTGIRRSAPIQQEALEEFQRRKPRPSSNHAAGHKIDMMYDLTGESGNRWQDYVWEDSTANTRDGFRGFNKLRRHPQGVPAGGIARSKDIRKFWNKPGFRTGMRWGGGGLLGIGTVWSLSSFGDDIASGNWLGASLSGTGFAGGALEIGGWAAGSSRLVTAGRFLGAPGAVIGSGMMGWQAGTYINENTGIQDTAMAGGSWVERQTGSMYLGAAGAAGTAIITSPYYAGKAAVGALGDLGGWIGGGIYNLFH